MTDQEKIAMLEETWELLRDLVGGCKLQGR